MLIKEVGANADRWEQKDGSFYFQEGNNGGLGQEKRTPEQPDWTFL